MQLSPGTPGITAGQRKLLQVRLARRARELEIEIARALEPGHIEIASRERETADVEAAVTVAGAQRDGAELAAVEAALARIAAGTYGLCVDCGAPLPRLRLDAAPEAARCVHCEEAREKEAPRPGSL